MIKKTEYLIIGSGRVARHFSHYFSLLGLPYLAWDRSQPVSTLHQHLAIATHVLLLISDGSIESFAEAHLQTHQGMHVHFSGSLISEKVIGAHPLQTFNNDLYELGDYQSISFVIDEDAPIFSELLPDLSNQHVRLAKKDKEKYHALCSMSGNFSCMLWQKLFTSLENEFHIPKEIAFPYLQRQMQNLLADADTALTGPLIRGDKQTVNKHLHALENDVYKDIYASFVASYENVKELA